MKHFKRALIFILVLSGFFFATRELGRMRRMPRELLEKETVVKRFPFDKQEEIGEWEDRVLAGGKASYEVIELEGEQCLRAHSTGNASTIFYRCDLKHQREPYVSWEWKAVKFPERSSPEKLGDKGEFDFVAQIYVIFDAPFLLNARAIQYLWTEEIAEGVVVPSPYTDKIRLVVLRSGLSEEWVTEKRDIKEDYRKFFGEELTKDIQAVAIMTDADSTSSEAEALFRDFELGYSKSEPDRSKRSDEKEPGEVEVKTEREPRRRGRFWL